MKPIYFMYLVHASYIYVVHVPQKLKMWNVPQKLKMWKHHTDHNRPDDHARKAETAVIFNENLPIPAVTDTSLISATKDV
jgi:hypothetical protein